MPRTKRLSAKAVRRLRRVQERILEEPRRVNMVEGILLRSSADGSALLVDGRRSGTDVEHWPPCNTVGCIAGHVCMVARKKPGTWTEQANLAAELLGSYYMQWAGKGGATSLFHEDYWPKTLRTRLLASKPGTRRYARVVAAAIDAWIAGDGSFDAPA